MFGTLYTQCQCCGGWDLGENFLCQNCIKDSKSIEHENELKKVLNWSKKSNFEKIASTLKDLNHYMNTKWLYANSLFQLREFEELEEFLDDWFEESFFNNDLLEYYIFCFRYGQYMEKKNLTNQFIMETVEKNFEKLSDEYKVRYYFFMAHFIFNPFNPRQSFDLLAKASEKSFNIRPKDNFRYSSFKEVRYKSLTFDGNVRYFKNDPLRYDLIIDIFDIASEFHAKLGNFPSFYQLKKQAIEFCFEDQRIIQAFHQFNTLIEVAKRHGDINELLQAITKYKISQVRFSSSEDLEKNRLNAITVILLAYMSINFISEAFQYLDESEKEFSSKGKFDTIKPLLYFDKGNYIDSSKIFWKSCEKALNEGNEVQLLINYIFYQRCRILDRSIPEKPLPINLQDFQLKYPDSKLVIYLLSIVNNSMTENDRKSLELVTKDELQWDYDEVLNKVIFDEKLVTYYNSWLQCERSEIIFEKLTELIDSNIRKYEVRNWRLPLINMKLTKLLIDYVAEKSIGIQSELKNLLNLAYELKLEKHIEFISYLNDKIDTKKKTIKKVEIMMPHLIRNLNYVISSKNLLRV